ncbi:hypothetical protein TTHERM_00375070 (macronuclear) [Tetrahymena thermophila SB210]|uniref:Uncharacterized protein n=1 Tax=Tetrahymena thermophila (strain SB210) TaxID=312017 RepID=I7LU44_TETTS|nr:hypothetical protein TTHERM_00375070 [Tetrahymena thermophila SB210]EAR89390.2 hypothetical protein TTHERM_00375070 [Tetrahymena thermophila SB210]|eukprot:XP_001009635.2 hypothetical protein TTHERM_00375070 [Tetrahymena thermophila SB210]
MGGAVCTKIDELGPKTKEIFELEFDMEQAELIESSDKYKLYRIKKNQKVIRKRGKSNDFQPNSKVKKGGEEEENIDGKILAVKFENYILNPGNFIDSYLPRDEKLLTIEPNKNIIKIFDIYSWEESKSVFQKVYIIENIQTTLRQELRIMEIKNMQYTDDEFIKLIGDLIQGLEFLRGKKLQVNIDVDHVYKVENDYKWASYESIALYDNPLPVQQELYNILQLVMLILKKVFHSNETSILKQNHQKSFKLIQQMQVYTEQNLSIDFYKKFYLLIENIKEQDNDYLFTKMVEEIKIKIDKNNQLELVEELKKFKPQELKLEIEGKDETLWRTVNEEIRKMFEIKQLEIKSNQSQITSLQANDICLAISSTCKMMDSLSLVMKENLLDKDFLHYFSTFFSQFEFVNLKLELSSNYLSSNYKQLRQLLVNQQNSLITLHLDLENNFVTKEEAIQLAFGFSRLYMLQHLYLNLSNNYISNYGYINLIECISCLSYLSSLSLYFSKCYIEYEGFLVTELLSNLLNLTQIKLDISLNNLKKKVNQISIRDFKKQDRPNQEQRKTEFFNNLIGELNQFQQNEPLQSPKNANEDKLLNPALLPGPHLIEEEEENSSKETQTKIKGLYGTANTLPNNFEEKDVTSFSNSKIELQQQQQSDQNIGSYQKTASFSLIQPKQNKQITNVVKFSSKQSSMKRIEEEKAESKKKQTQKNNPFLFVNNPQLGSIYLNLCKTNLVEEQLQLLLDKIPKQREKLKYLRLNIQSNSELKNFKQVSDSIMYLKDCIELEINCEKNYYDLIDRDFVDFNLSSLLCLRKLTLNFNYIYLQLRQIMNLFQSIQYLSELTELELCLFENQLENQGIMLLGESLKNLKKLVYLKLFCYKIGLQSYPEESENMLIHNQNLAAIQNKKILPNSGQSISFQNQTQPQIGNIQSPLLIEQDYQDKEIENNELENDQNLNNFKDIPAAITNSNITGSILPQQLQSPHNNIIINQQQQINALIKQHSIALSAHSPAHGHINQFASHPENMLAPISKAISQMNQLQTLKICLSFNILGVLGLQQFSQCLNNKSNLTKLSLSFRNCMLDKSDNFSYLLNSLNGVASNLKILNLNLKNNLNLNQSISISNNYFQNMVNLEDLTLNFQKSDLADLGITNIATNLLFITKTLKNLSISLSEQLLISDQALFNLFISISKCQNLETIKLDLSKNVYLNTLQGIENFNKILNLKQYSLQLSKCTIDLIGGANISTSYYFQQPKLEILNLSLSNNQLASPGLQSLSNSLQTLTSSLKQLILDLESNSIEENAFQKLFNIISEMTELTLLELDLSKNSLQSIQPQNFSLILPTKCQLKKLTLILKKTFITPQMCSALFLRMKKLTKIVDLTLDFSQNMLEKSQSQVINPQQQINNYQQQQLLQSNNAIIQNEKQNPQPETEQSNQVLVVPGHQKGASNTSLNAILKAPSGAVISQNYNALEKPQDKILISHQNNPSSLSIISFPPQLYKRNSMSAQIVNSLANPFEAFPEALQNMNHLCSLKLNIMQNMSALNTSLFYITHGIVASCINMHHIKVKSEAWNACYSSFMLYFIEVKNQIQTILARNKILISLSEQFGSSILNDWNLLYTSTIQ